MIDGAAIDGGTTATRQDSGDKPAPRTADARMARRWLVGLAVANVLLGAALLAWRPPTRAASVVLPPPAPPAQVQALQDTLAAGRHGEPYTLDLSDAELTAMAGYFLARAPDIPFADVRVAVAGHEVVAQGVTKGLVVPVPVRVTGTVAARDGLPRATLTDVSLGSVALPAGVREQIIREANASLDFSRYNMPITVETVETLPGGIRLQGVVK